MTATDLTAIAAAVGVLTPQEHHMTTTIDDLCTQCLHLLDQHSLGTGHCTADCGCTRAKRPGFSDRVRRAVAAWLVEDSTAHPPLTKARRLAGEPSNVFDAIALDAAREAQREEVTR